MHKMYDTQILIPVTTNYSILIEHNWVNIKLVLNVLYGMVVLHTQNTSFKKDNSSLE